MAHHRLLFYIEVFAPGDDFELEAAKRSYFPGYYPSMRYFQYVRFVFRVASKASATENI